MSETPFRLLPRLDDDNREFWTSGASGQLALQRCSDCGYYIHPPGPVCPRCLSRALRYETVSGRGTVATFTVNYQPWNPTMPTPYVIALVELAEQPGLRLMTNIVQCDPADVHIGLPVQVRFESHEDVWIPLFEPATAS